MSKLCQLALSAAIVFAFAGFAIADEADELREQAERMRREANELAELGRVE